MSCVVFERRTIHLSHSERQQCPYRNSFYYSCCTDTLCLPARPCWNSCRSQCLAHFLNDCTTTVIESSSLFFNHNDQNSSRELTLSPNANRTDRMQILLSLRRSRRSRKKYYSSLLAGRAICFAKCRGKRPWEVTEGMLGNEEKRC